MHPETLPVKRTSSRGSLGATLPGISGSPCFVGAHTPSPPACGPRSHVFLPARAPPRAWRCKLEERPVEQWRTAPGLSHLRTPGMTQAPSQADRSHREESPLHLTELITWWVWEIAAHDGQSWLLGHLAPHGQALRPCLCPAGLLSQRHRLLCCRWLGLAPKSCSYWALPQMPRMLSTSDTDDATGAGRPRGPRSRAAESWPALGPVQGWQLSVRLWFRVVFPMVGFVGSKTQNAYQQLCLLFRGEKSKIP